MKDVSELINQIAALQMVQGISGQQAQRLEQIINRLQQVEPALKALDCLEAMTREGYGPSFTQRTASLGGRGALDIGTTPDTFAAAIIALHDMVKKPPVALNRKAVAQGKPWNQHSNSIRPVDGHARVEVEIHIGKMSEPLHLTGEAWEFDWESKGMCGDVLRWRHAG